MKIQTTLLALSGFALLYAAPAGAASTSLTQAITPGLLTLTSRPNATMSTVTADAVHNQTSSGSLGAVEATDSRGNGAGWSVTATCSNFVRTDNPSDTISPENLTVTPSDINAMVGAYQGVQSGSAHTFSDPNDSATLMSAAPGSGQGWYITAPALALNIAPATHSGNFVATVTETIN